MAATRKSRSQKYSQHSVDPHVLPVVIRALENPYTKKPSCPLPDCEWESYLDTDTWRMSAQASAKGRLKRHLRDKHRAYYNLASTKPFVIYEEEDQPSWHLTSMSSTGN